MHPVLKVEEAQDFEEVLLRHREQQWEAVRSAGRRVAELLWVDFLELTAWPQPARVLLLVGKGHNGADALVAGSRLRELLPGCELFLLAVSPRETWRSLTKEAGKLLEKGGPVVEIDVEMAAQALFDVCLDGALGMRSKPPLSDDLRAVLRAINGNPRVGLRVAVDLPSGLGDPDAFRADFTYATGIVKSPALAAEFASVVGRLRYADIGFFEVPGVNLSPSGVSFVSTDVLLRPLLRMRSPLVDKRSFGHVVIVGGHQTMPGALLLNVKAALRAGVGLVTACGPASVVPALAAAAPEAMWVPLPEGSDGGLDLSGLAAIGGRLKRATALLLGSGLGEGDGAAALVSALIECAAVPLVLDASALTARSLADLKARPPTAPTAILTPHAGEFRRLTSRLWAAATSADAGSSGMAAGRSGVGISGGVESSGGRESCGGAGDGWATPSDEELRAFCAGQGGSNGGLVTVLKGHRSRVADSKTVLHCLSGGPILARGGTGDLLAGMIGGLLAQTPEEPFLAAARAQHWYGLAADALARECGHQAVTTTDLLPALTAALRRL